MGKAKVKGEDALLTRASYINLKKVDRLEAEHIVKDFYNQGFEDGKKAADFKGFIESLNSVQGIGEKTIQKLKTLYSEYIKA